VLLSLVSVVLAVLAVGMLSRVASGLSVSHPLPEFVTAVNAADTAAVSTLLAGDSEEWVARSEWLANTGAALKLSSCIPGEGTSITCSVRFGNDWFFNRAAPPDIAKHGWLGTVLAVEIDGDQVRITDFPLPAGLADVEEPFRQWVVRTHPASVPLMWDTAGPDLESRMRIDAAGGAAHQALVEEYVEYLNLPSTLAPG
jgi:hypothetical protein